MTVTTIWKIQVPVGSGFAELNRHYKDPVGTKCPQCRAIVEIEHEPLTVEWEDGSDQIGDFVHAGADIVVQDYVAEQLRRIATGFTTLPIELFDHPNLRKPATIPNGVSEPRVWLPYGGPPLSQLIATRKVPLAQCSTIEVASRCEACGTIRYKRIRGVERKTHALVKPRQSGRGLFVNASELPGNSIFSPVGTSLILCTSGVKEFAEKECYSNVEFLEYGDII